MSNPLVSVVISCYNHELYIREAIDSVMAQTYDNFELIITDDGSTDHSKKEIIDALNHYNDDRIRCDLREENSCFVCVENAYHSARGKYIAGMGGDDAMRPEKLQKQVEFLENCGDAYQACFTWVTATGDEENRERAENYESLFRKSDLTVRELWLQMLETNCLCAPSMMMKRSIYEELGGYNFLFRQLQDYELWLRFMLKYRLFILPEPLTVYRAVTGSISDITKSGTANARTGAEGEIILFEIIRDMSDELFEEIFPDDDPAHHTHADILCRKVKSVFERAKAVADFQIGLKLYYSYRREQGFLQLMETRYGYTRRVIHQVAGEASVYAAVQHWMEEAGVSSE